MHEILCTSTKNKRGESLRREALMHIEFLKATLENLIYTMIHSNGSNVYRFVTPGMIPKVIPLIALLEGKYAMTSYYFIVKLFLRSYLRERLDTSC